MSEREVLEFDGRLVTVNIVLDDASCEELRDIWVNRVKGIQQPLIETYKNGLHVTIPWVMKDE